MLITAKLGYNKQRYSEFYNGYNKFLRLFMRCQNPNITTENIAQKQLTKV